ncbi:hypothetical protein, partial [Kitasatospora sp. NPDC093558]|uniref:hypothetical protein n=1 Tax=Kitasatospora sp. NPDC093558 TaxID=3155201 RepID=UPI00342B69E2
MIPHNDALLVLGAGTFKQERFLLEPRDAGLTVLAVDEAGRVPALERAASQPGHPLSGARIAGAAPEDVSAVLAAAVAWEE